MYDYQEKIGFLLSNGKYVTTDPDKKYTDEDEVDDRTELGRRCRFEDLDLSQQVEFESELSYHSDYLECWDMLSDPTNPDSDGDTYKDDEDAIPLRENPDCIYIFALEEFKDQGRRLLSAYLSEGKNVFLDNFNDTASFCKLWSTIGMTSDSPSDIASGKYYYNVTNVVISTHGSKKSIVTCSGEKTNRLYATYESGDTIGMLANKRFDCLNLYACSCAENYETEETIAEDFLNCFYDINRVVAFDTTLINAFVDSHYYYYGSWFNDKDFIEKEDYMSL